MCPPPPEAPATSTRSATCCMRRKPSKTVKLAGVLSGVILGCVGCITLVLLNVLLGKGQTEPSSSDPGRLLTVGDNTGDSPFSEVEVRLPAQVALRMPLYVGVLTMEGFLSSRAASCNRTWARDPLISRVEYFARLGPASQHHHQRGLDNIVNLTDIEGDDIYHRQASFRMLQSICERHIEQYDWFVRAVDDAYIKVNELLSLLSTLNKDTLHYLGHPSLGETELGVATSGGRYYCLGGPAIVFSRQALLGICPHIQECERKFNRAPADVELGRCMHSVLGLQCRRSSQFRKKFYNSYERNAFKLVEEFVNADSAISLHPLKSQWLMTTIHRQVSRDAISRLSQRLSWLRSRENTLAVTVMTKNNSRGLETKIEDLHPVPLTVVTSSFKEMNAGTCSPVINMTKSAILELSEAIRVSNASFLYGDNLRCRHLVDGHFLRDTPGVTTSYVTNMACHNITQPKQCLLAKAQLKAPHRELAIKRIRQREMQSKMVVFLHAYFGDPKLMEFLIMWKNVLQQGYIENNMLVLFLVYNTHRHRHSSLDMEFALSDLDRWKRDNRLNLVTYLYNSSVSISKMHETALRNLSSQFRDAVILLAQPHLTFDSVFLQKCKFFVRPGKQIYRPYAEHSVIYRHSGNSSPTPSAVTETLWTEEFSPVCIHTTDLQKRKKQTKSGPSKRKSLKMISSFDMNLQLDIL